MIYKLQIICLFTLVFLLFGCSKTVYVYTDLLGSSKYTLYKNNYKYEETSYNGDFSVRGYYEVKNGNILFLCKDKSRIPYHYYGGSVLPKENENYDGEFYIHVSHIIHKEAIVNANVLFIDSLGNLVGQTYTDMAGYALLTPSQKIKHLVVEVFEHARFQMPYPQNPEYNYFVALESLQPGGRMINNCLSNYEDVLLQYRKKSKGREIMQFERNGVTFVKDGK